MIAKKQLTNMKWEQTPCYLCHSLKEPERIRVQGENFVNGQFGYAVHPVICECGLVYLNPRWSKKEYDIFYTYHYDELYRLETKPDYGVSGVLKNMEGVWKRIKDIVVEREVKNILDVGCGSGYGLKYLQDELPGAKIFGIESSPSCGEQFKEMGGTLIATDFDSPWTDKYRESIDLVILRHVVEHMLDPVASLSRIREVLSDNGLIYLATPDMMHPRTVLRDYDFWPEYWFRAVHPYYFSLETLIKTLELAQLYPVSYGQRENEEVWCLVGKKKSQTFPEKADLYQRQKEVLQRTLP